MSETTGTERVAGAPLTAAERAWVEENERQWRKVEATPEFQDLAANLVAPYGDGVVDRADGPTRARWGSAMKGALREISDTPRLATAVSTEMRIEANIEARIMAGEEHIPHPVTAVERAAAMQQAREQAFNASASVDYEARRYSQTETAKFTL